MPIIRKVKGKVCIVTGATSGIGAATARALAERGATVGIVCRDLGRGEATLAEIRKAAPAAELRLFRADLASQAEIRAVAAEILGAHPRIHVLVNNAGVVNLQRSTTVDGIETVFAVNHLAYFLLTRLLLDRLIESAPARIVNVASHAHRFVRELNFADPGFEKDYASMRVYGHSKLANILFTRALARRLEGTGVTVNAVHPGAVATGLGQNNGAWTIALTRFLGLFFASPARGASTSIWAATAPELDGVSGRYFARSREASLSPGARDDEAAERLWRLSEELTGLAPAGATAGAGT